ncbi:MAG: hypothetical protein KBC21_00765 [Candidatus Pacebacteria bacterium]|nr:hypothetical protein [Candidatus Paceibacterota bacterium]
MADATSGSFGDSQPKPYSETTISSVKFENNLDPKNPGTFVVNKAITSPSFNPYARLTTTTPSTIRVGGELRPKNRKEQITWAAEQKARLTAVITGLGWLENCGWEIDGLEEKRKEYEELVIAVQKTDDANSFKTISLRIENLRLWVEEEIEVTKDFEKENSIKLELLKSDKRRRFNQLDRRANSLTNSKDYKKIQDILEPFSWLQVDSTCSDYTGELTPIDEALDKAEALIEVAEKEISRKKLQLEISAGLAIANLDSKIPEIESLLQNTATVSLKDATDQLLVEVNNLKPKLLSDDVTENDVTEFNKKLVAVSLKTTELKSLIERKSLEKLRLVREASSLVTEYNKRRGEVATLLQNQYTTSEKAATEALLAELDVMSRQLNSDTVTDTDIAAFSTKNTELQNKVGEIEQLIQAGESRQEAGLSWRIAWPSNIYRTEGKKANNKTPATDPTWNIGTVVVPQEQFALWDQIFIDQKVIFANYTAFFQKAQKVKKVDEFKDLIKLKESLLSNLRKGNIDTAALELKQLEDSVETNKAFIDNVAELEELSAKFETTVATLDRLKDIPGLERSLLDANKKELEALLSQLNDETNQKDVTKTKESLRMFRSILDMLVSAVSEKEKESIKEGGARRSEFLTLARELEKIKTTVEHHLGDAISTEEKVELTEEITKVGKTATSFSDFEAKQQYDDARESLILFRAAITELTAKVKEKEAKAAKVRAEKKEKETKKEEAYDALKKEFKEEVGKFKTAKDALENLKAFFAQELWFIALERSKIGLDELVTLFENKETKDNPKEAKRVVELFKKLLEKFIRDIGTKEALAKKDFGDNYRLGVLRPVNRDANIRVKDKTTGEYVDMKVGDWQNIQSGNTNPDLEREAKAEKIAKAEEELRQVHRRMRGEEETDPLRGLAKREAYIKMYAGRVWTTSDGDKMTQKIVNEFLGGNVERIDDQLEALEEELDRRDFLIKEKASRQLTPGEQLELDSLEVLVAPLIKEKRKFTERPYEEPVKMMRAKAAQKTTLTNNREVYSPAGNRRDDWIEFRNRTLTPEETKRTKIAKFNRDQEAIKNKYAKIPGVTKTTADGTMPSITSGDMGEGNEKLAGAVFPTEVKIDTKDPSGVAGGMTRSVLTEERFLKENKDSVQVPNHGISFKPLTQEEQVRKTTQVTSLLGSVGKFAKSWKTWLSIGAFIAGTMGPGLATAQADPTRPVTTIEQVISWKDFLGGLDERERGDMQKFVEDLSGPQKLDYENFIKKYAKTLNLDDNKESKKSELNAINVAELLNGASTGIYSDPEIRTELSRIAMYLQKINQMIDDHKMGKHSYQKRVYVYTAETLSFKGLFDFVQNLANRNK